MRSSGATRKQDTGRCGTTVTRTTLEKPQLFPLTVVKKFQFPPACQVRRISWVGGTGRMVLG